MWIITTDRIDNGEKAGTSSRNYNEANAALLRHRFRLLDDDGEIYYEGMSDDCGSQRAFAPLDDFGKGYAGCTEIHYFTDGVWQQL